LKDKVIGMGKYRTDKLLKWIDRIEQVGKMLTGVNLDDLEYEVQDHILNEREALNDLLAEVNDQILEFEEEIDHQ
jgi:hypothetical protein